MALRIKNRSAKFDVQVTVHRDKLLRDQLYHEQRNCPKHLEFYSQKN